MNNLKIITLALFSEWKLFYEKNINDFHLLNKIGKQYLYRYSNSNIIFFQTGIGSNISFDILNNYIKNFENLNVDIFNIGLCGIIKSDNFNIEDILVPKYIQNEFSDIKYINNIINFNFKKCHFLITTKNPILNLDEFVNNPKIISSDIVDMEAYYIADYCHKYTYKFNTIKITSDYCSNNPEKIIKTNLKNLQIKISEVINFLINDYFKNKM